MTWLGVEWRGVENQDPMSTGETTESLVDQLATSGGWPEPHVLAAILERGSEAVEPLRAMLRRDPEDEDGTSALSLAIDLLGSLGDASAVPDMLDVLRCYDEIDVLEALRSAMRAFGPELIEPALEIARDRSLPNYPRATAAEIAVAAAGDDLIERSKVAEALREMLAEYVSRGATEDVEDAEMATSLVSSLADLADPLARELIAAAFQAEIVDGWVISEEDVEESYARGGMPSGGQWPWLHDYERDYEEHQAWLRRKAEPRPEPRDDATRLPEPARPTPPTVTPIKNATPRTGRNDPCWCGSGKKYKKCHLAQDQG
jgi:hypothetical protein